MRYHRPQSAALGLQCRLLLRRRKSTGAIRYRAVRSGAAGSEPAEKGRHDGAADAAADGQGDAGADPLRPQRGGGQGGGAGRRRQRLSGKALPSGGAGGPHPQSDPAAVHPTGRAAHLRRPDLRHPRPDGLRRRAAADPHPQGDGHSGVPDAPSGPSRQSGGADGARLGQQRGQLQQFHPCAHLRAAEKAAYRTGL